MAKIRILYVIGCWLWSHNQGEIFVVSRQQYSHESEQEVLLTGSHQRINSPDCWPSPPNSDRLAIPRSGRFPSGSILVCGSATATMARAIQSGFREQVLRVDPSRFVMHSVISCAAPISNKISVWAAISLRLPSRQGQFLTVL